MVSAQDFSDHSCFEAAWICTVQRHSLGTTPQASRGEVESSHPLLAPRLPLPFQVLTRSDTPSLLHATHNTDVSVQADTRDWASGVVTRGLKVSSL